jgi:uncharacterized protein (TIGR03437 family)
MDVRVGYSKRRGIMILRQVVVLAGLGLAVASGQTQDTSGNGLLKGNYQFRNVAVQAIDTNGNPTEVTATYGSIVFDGNGNYTITGTQVDNTVSGGAPQAVTIAGTYAIGANGAGYVASPLYPTDGYDFEYGAVSQGVFAGSATEAEGEGYVLNDIFVAIPVSATAPTNASFTASYQTGLLDMQGGGSTSTMNALFQLTPNGQGNFGTITLSGQASNQTAATVTQTISGAAYNFSSNGSATPTIPQASGGVSSTNDLFASGQKTMYQSADGNFILGWTNIGYDIFFGVKTLATAGSNSITKGLYFTAALEDSVSSSGVDSYYGGDSVSGDSAGDAVVHARLNFPQYLAYDFGTDDQIDVNSNGATTTPDYSGYLYLFGDGGNAFVGIGTGGNFSLVVGLHAATFSGPGVYLSPIGVANAASYQPITASLAPGELIVLTGSGLYSGSGVDVAPSGAFPKSLGGVSVTIDGTPCAIYYVSAGQIAVVAPYELASNTSGYANIQVTNNSVLSNVVQMYTTDAAPGSFSQSANGIGYAAAIHAATGALITTANPAVGGEYISLFLTGLGAVTPTVVDGALGPTSPLSIANEYTSGYLMVNFNDYNNGSTGNQGTIQFAGLAPNLAGLYQINVQVPSGVLGAGDNVYIEFITDYADVNQIQIPYGSAAAVKTESRRARSFGQARATLLRSRKLLPQRVRSSDSTHVCSNLGRLSASRVCIP